MISQSRSWLLMPGLLFLLCKRFLTGFLSVLSYRHSIVTFARAFCQCVNWILISCSQSTPASLLATMTSSRLFSTVQWSECVYSIFDLLFFKSKKMHGKVRGAGEEPMLQILGTFVALISPLLLWHKHLWCTSVPGSCAFVSRSMVEGQEFYLLGTGDVLPIEKICAGQTHISKKVPFVAGPVIVRFPDPIYSFKSA